MHTVPLETILHSQLISQVFKKWKQFQVIFENMHPIAYGLLIIIRIENSFKILERHIAYNKLYKVHYGKLKNHWIHTQSIVLCPIQWTFGVYEILKLLLYIDWFQEIWCALSKQYMEDWFFVRISLIYILQMLTTEGH